MTNHLLDVQDLHISFDTHAGEVQAVRGVSFWLDAGEMLSIVGESGCGKTTVGRTLLRIYEPDGGSIVFDGQDISKVTRHRPRL